MLQTLFSIPAELFGLPVFGVGLLLGVWVLFSVGFLAFSGYRRGWGAETWMHLPMLIIVAAAIVFVLPNLVEGAGLPIRGYGVMMLVGVVTGVGLAMHRAQAARIDPEKILSLAFWLFAAGIAGARLFHVIEYWDQQYRQPKEGPLDPVATFKQVINIPAGGLVVYGSLIAGSIALVWFVKKNKLPGLALCDLIAPSMVLGLAFGRIGCLLNGCCFGGVCEPPLPWQVTFPQEAPPYGRQVEKGLLFGIQVEQSDEWIDAEEESQQGYVPQIDWVQPDSPAEEQGLQPGAKIVEFNGHPKPTTKNVMRSFETIGTSGIVSLKVEGDDTAMHLAPVDPPARSLPVHPTQIYSAVNAFLICLLLLAYYPYRRRDGEVFALLLTIYPITRFLIEAIRIDEHGMFGTPLSISQLVSIALLIGVAGLWMYLLKQPAGKLYAGRGT